MAGSAAPLRFTGSRGRQEAGLPPNPQWLPCVSSAIATMFCHSLRSALKRAMTFRVGVVLLAITFFMSASSLPEHCLPIASAQHCLLCCGAAPHHKASGPKAHQQASPGQARHERRPGFTGKKKIQAPTGHDNSRSRSVPHIPLIDLHAMLPAQRAKLILKRHLSMVLLLRRDVFADLPDFRLAH